MRNQVKFVSHTTEPASLLPLYYHPLYNIADGFGGLRAGFEYYRVSPLDANENKISLVKEGKLQMPVLALAGDFYPAVGGHIPGNVALYSTQLLAANVRGITVPLLRSLDSRRAARHCNKTACQFLWW